MLLDGVHELPDLVAYSHFMRDNPAEATALLKDLLISVTNFFRDKDAFAALEHEILPRIFQGKHADDQLRIWVVGCATGEEAYSLAIAALETFGQPLPRPIEIWATDLSEPALQKARAGFYRSRTLTNLSASLLARYFQIVARKEAT